MSILTITCVRHLFITFLHVFLILLASSISLLAKASTEITPQNNQINLSQVRHVGENDCAYKSLTQAYESIGYQLNFQIMPSKRALVESNAGRTDGETARIQYLEERYPNLVRIPIAICHMHQNLYALKTNASVDRLGIQDIKLGIINGGVFVEKEYTHYNPVRAINNQQLVNLLLKGRVDAISMADKTFLKQVNQEQASLVKTLDRYNPTVPLFHYLHKKHQALIPKITAALKRLEESGFIADAIKNHQP
ncbi:transporter substrate-binding domain-containing protein [Paraglaciecola aquimarina]|uniref:Transporter substrate-binding domain-containing protein n=1 Tax=Paraglaciecola algarum TaxID=3050085 RepID=A0ABS9D5W3_9ALTE|nr:transporter substrate-binding domain-containing protein [Paraglaciecola sp. G1-23]MCF2947822.1 transporter substrate-binding domain-containing protein [Paraglaciecola sp. G1-23]